MFKQKINIFIHKIALFAIFFAAIAPSISHALMAQHNANSFLQEVCTGKANGNKILLRVVTTQGKELTTEFSLNKPSIPKSLGVHLEHCPFCASQASVATLPASNLLIIAQLEATAQRVSKYALPVVPVLATVLPPAQAPPAL